MDWISWLLVVSSAVVWFVMGMMVERARWSRVLQDNITKGYDAPTSDDTWMKPQQ